MFKFFLYQNDKNHIYLKGKIQVLYRKWTKMFSSIVRGIKGLYHIISVISTLSIFTAFLLFAIGKIGLEKSSDDDLIMQSIKKQVPENLEILDISVQDIHGFGNESLIVLATDLTFSNEDQLANQMLIFDKVENDVLNRIYNLFGYGSNYKLSYIFSLGDESEDFSAFGYWMEILDVVELTNDMSKEIVVMFMQIPSGTSGYYQIGIFSYSFEMKKYYLVGTYPPVDGYELELDQNAYYWNIPAPTILRANDLKQYNYYNQNEVFQLEYGTYDDNDFYIENESGDVFLVRTQMIWGDESHVDPHRHIISVFIPRYDKENDELRWNVIFSKETKEYTTYCTKEFVLDFLKENGLLDILF